MSTELSIHEKEWREFPLVEIFPDIQRGKRLKRGDHVRGDMPYISSSSAHNGVDEFVGNTGNIRIYSNCLTIANSGSVGATFYQPFHFVASDHVTKLSNPLFNKYIYLFLAVTISRVAEKYSFNREINDLRIRKERILLPTNSTGNPDFEFMGEYMYQKEREKNDSLIREIALRMDAAKDYKPVKTLASLEWKEFEIGKLFALQQGKSKGLNHLRKQPKGINYLGATNLNNGVLCQVEAKPSQIQKGNSIAFIRNGEGSMGYSIYKSEDFIATSDISVGHSDFLNRYVGLFITTVADKVRGKYNFGYKRSDRRLKKEKILLPVTNKGKPDFEYMENYVKKLEYLKLSKYAELMGRTDQ